MPKLTGMLGVALIASMLGAHPLAHACIAREPTPSTGPGPHDFTHGVPDPTLWREGDAGEPLAFKGRVLDACGNPVPQADVRILHANQDGDHEPDRWRAELVTGEDGGFRLLTVYPGYTGGIPRHIHFIIEHPEHRTLVTRLFFKNDPEVDHGIEDLAMVLEEVQRESGRESGRGWVASFEFVLSPR